MFRKAVAIVLSFVLLIMLPSCSLKGSQDKIVASAYGVELTKQQVEMAMASYCGNYGMTLDDLKGDKEIWERMKTDFVGSMVIEAIASHKAEEFGYDFNETQQAEFNKSFEDFLASLDENNKLEAMTDGATGKDAIKASSVKLRERYFSALGYTEESFRDKQRMYFITQKMKLQFADKINVTDDDVKSYYDSNVKNQKKATLAANASSNPMAPSTVLYNPNGYKYIKSLLLEFPSSVITLSAKMYTDNSPEFEPLIKREISLLQPKIDEIRKEIEKGTDFDSLIEKYGQDVAMTVEPTKSKGYFIASDDDQLIPSFKKGVDGLKKTGDIQECFTYKGYMFLYAQEVVSEGATPYEEVSGILKQNLLQDKQAIEWDRLTQGWLKEGKESGDVVLNLSVLD